VPLETKIADLLAADEAAARIKGIAFTESSYAAQREWKTFAATDGSLTEQVITHVGSAVEANAIDGDEHQRRSYPDPGGWQAAGTSSSSVPPAERVEPLADEAVQPLTAPQCPPGRFTIILDPSQLYPGPRVAPPDRARPCARHGGVVRRDQLPDDRQARRASATARLTVADATAPGGMGTFGWDDEGVAAQAVPLIKEGIFVGTCRRARPRHVSGARVVAPCELTAGNGSRSSG
jgi:TldD protein